MNICYLSAINPHIFKYPFFIFFFCFKFYSANHYFLFQITQAYLRTEFLHIQIPHRRCDLHKFFLIYNPYKSYFLPAKYACRFSPTCSRCRSISRRASAPSLASIAARRLSCSFSRTSSERTAAWLKRAYAS